MTDSVPHYTGVKRIVYAFYYSLCGVRAAFQHEVAFRQELLLCVVLVPLALWLDVTLLARVWLLSSLFLLLLAELANSAIETVVDRISTAVHPLSKRAKDIGSALVLLAIVHLVMVWGLIFGGEVMGLF